MDALDLVSISLYQAAVKRVQELHLFNSSFWADERNNDAYNRYYDIKSNEGFTTRQMTDLYPALAHAVSDIERHVNNIASGAEQAKVDQYAALSAAFDNIGSYFGLQASFDIKQGKSFYDAVHDAYQQSQSVRVLQLDGISIPLKDAIGIGHSKLLGGFSRKLKLSESEFAGVMQSKAFAVITIDEHYDHSSLTLIIDKLAALGIETKQSRSDENTRLLHVQFDQLQRPGFKRLAQEYGLCYDTLVDENPFGKRLKDKPATIDAMRHEELCGLRAALNWALINNNTSRLHAEIGEIDDLLSDAASPS